MKAVEQYIPVLMLTMLVLMLIMLLVMLVKVMLTLESVDEIVVQVLLTVYYEMQGGSSC